ncbi:MAG: TldD/PmbA family protein [Candidatus Baldrarchaeia archaeon]
MLENLMKIGIEALKLASRQGADQLEVFTAYTRTRNIYVENSVPHLSTNNVSIGIGLKCAIGKRVGFAASTVFSKKDIERVVEECISITKVSPEDPNFESLPDPRKPSGTVKNVYDEDLIEIEESKLLKAADKIVETAEKGGKVKVLNGLMRLGEFAFHITNSLGVDQDHKGTLVFLHFSAKASENGRVGEGVEKAYSTTLKNMDFEKLGSELRRKTLTALNAEPYKGKEEIPIIIVPVELQGLFESTVAFAISGEHVNKRRSPWKDKLNERVASEALTIVDDGRMSGGILSALIDDEGVPTGTKTIVDKGVLKNFIYDTYDAYIADTESTGNGYRRFTRTVEEIFSRPASCTISNMEVKPGDKDLENMINEIDRGCLIEKFAAPYADPFTGAFGLEIRCATLIENGSLGKPIRHALLSGNFYEAIKNILMIGREQELVENMKLPPIAFEKLELIGQ